MSGSVCLGVLAGDINADGTTNIFDLVAVRNNLNQTVTDANFRSDINTDGEINILDVVLARNGLNKTIAGSCP